MHNRDLHLLFKVQKFFGVGNVTVNKGVDANSSYEVATKADLKIILQHFNRYPLLTSKRHTFYNFTTVFEIFCRADHLNIIGFKQMVYYINLLNNPIKHKNFEVIKKKFFGGIALILLPVPTIKSVNIPSPWWVIRRRKV